MNQNSNNAQLLNFLMELASDPGKQESFMCDVSHSVEEADLSASNKELLLSQDRWACSRSLGGSAAVFEVMEPGLRPASNVQRTAGH